MAESDHSTLSPDQDFCGILYKYTDQDGAEKILSTRTLRFARPAEMNDPFDVYIDDLFGIDLGEFSTQSKARLFDVLLDNPTEFAHITGVETEAAEARAGFLRRLSKPERNALKQALVSLDFAGIDQEFLEHVPVLSASRDDFVRRFKSYGIFCATRTYRNILMWAHYADGHRGAVFGFRPDLERDSFLRLIKPVAYSAKRPFLLDEGPEMLTTLASITSPMAFRPYTQRLLHTKSAEWSYEEELRLCIPEEIKDGERASLLPFYPNELEEVYLGYRMEDQNRKTIMELARTLNPTVKVFSCALAKRQYSLEFGAFL